MHILVKTAIFADTKHRPGRVGKSDFQKVKTEHFRAFVPEGLQSVERQDVLRTAKRKEHVAKEQSKANNPKTIESSPFISPGQCARLLGVSRRSIYNYLAANSIPCFQFKGKTLISRNSLDSLFDGSHLYQLRLAKEKQTITEFYTTKEVLEKFGISNSWLFKAAKENNFPKLTQRGKTLWSKPHIDRFFAKSAQKEEITEWYTAAEIQERYGMSLSAIYNLVSKERIPKMKIGCEARYSKLLLSAKP